MYAPKRLNIFLNQFYAALARFLGAMAHKGLRLEKVFKVA